MKPLRKKLTKPLLALLALIVLVSAAAYFHPANRQRRLDYQLHHATYYGDLATMEALLEKGANPNVLFPQYGPKHSFAQQLSDLWARMTNRGGPEYHFTPTRLSALERAIAHHDPQRIHLLLQHGADPNMEDSERHTPLVFATQLPAPECVEALLQGGADPNAGFHEFSSPLRWAVRNSDYQIAELLLRHGADVNLRNKIGGTVLIEASEVGDIKMIRLLLQHGADVSPENSNGQSALNNAKNFNRTDIINLLKAHGAKE